MWCCTGGAAQAQAVTRPMRTVGAPLLDHVGEMPFPALQSIFDPLLPPGLHWYWRADFLHPYSAGGAYVNFMMDEGQERVRASFRDNYERLRAVKKTYDPENFFGVNQNIRPAE
jgi:hypothetical protein